MRADFAIIILGCFIAVIVTFALHWIDSKGRLVLAGSPPTTQVLVDIFGIIVTCLICEALLGATFAGPPP